MKLGKRIGSFMLALAVIITLVMVPKFDSNAFVASPTFLYQTGASANAISFKWTGTADAAAYDVIVRVQNSYGQVVASGTVPATQTSVSFNNVAKGVQYYAQVYAVKDGVRSSGYASNYLYAMPLTPGEIYIDTWYQGKNNPYIRWAGAGSNTYNFTPNGYEVKITTLAGKKISTVSTYSTSLYKSMNKVKNAGFKISIRSYVNVSIGSGQYARLYSDWSKAKAFVPGAKVKKAELIDNSTGKLTWKKVKNAKSYTIYRKSGSKFKKVKTVKGTSTTLKKDYFLNGIIVAPNVKVKGKTYKSTILKQKNVRYDKWYLRTRYY